MVVFMNYKMLKYYRIDNSDGIDIIKAINKTFNHEPYLCNDCHDLMQKAIHFNDVAIISVKEVIIELTFGI